MEMTELEKVIEGLCDAIGIIHGYVPKRYWGYGEQACRDAIELLKEKEAVEPIPFFTETGAESPNYVICGHCKSIKAIMPKYTKQKYCHECGFPVLWEGR